MLTFPSKILLFGEYTVIKGATGLAIPFKDFSGAFRFNSEKKLARNLKDLLGFIQQTPLKFIDQEKVTDEFESGLFFDSTIPQGYGLGSSGALVASLYERFCTRPTDDIAEIKKNLSKLEAFYHGQSSGIDPLVSYVQKPVLIKGPEKVEIVTAPVEEWKSTERFFLYDSGVARTSSELVKTFKEKCESEDFVSKCLRELTDLNDEAVDTYLEMQDQKMTKLMENISKLQLECFSEMIPPQIETLWREGLENRRFLMKLCGAGGGGMFLGLKLKESLVINPRFRMF